MCDTLDLEAFLKIDVPRVNCKIMIAEMFPKVEEFLESERRLGQPGMFARILRGLAETKKNLTKSVLYRIDDKGKIFM